MLNNKLFKNWVALSLLTLLTACATPSFSPQSQLPAHQPLQLNEIYIRGIFNWWEAEPAYLLQESPATNTFSVTVDLIADGQPYDFRLADEYWTPHKSCGAKQLSVISVNQPVKLFCAENSQNLQFVPSVTGSYRFAVTQSGGELTLIIQKQS